MGWRETVQTLHNGTALFVSMLDTTCWQAASVSSASPWSSTGSSCEAARAFDLHASSSSS